MNKQELIGKYEYLNHNFFRRVDTSEVLRDLKQLDEPEKVKVPQSVADWYEEHKDDFEFNVWDWIAFRDELEKLENKEFTSWINDCEGNPIQILVNMHQFGYEVEKEKRYYIRLKIDDKNYNYLNYIKHLSAWCLAGIKKDKKFRTEHTRKQLEDAGFGEVFNSTLFEVEEV